FFFQAEDGIRDFHVTGVQTCALPILLHSDRERCGDVLHTHDPREMIPVPEHVAHYFVAGTRTVDTSAKKLRSDYLVTPGSALAEDYPGTDAVKRDLLHGIDHFQLMWNDAVYARLQQWLEKG